MASEKNRKIKNGEKNENQIHASIVIRYHIGNSRSFCDEFHHPRSFPSTGSHWNRGYFRVLDREENSHWSCRYIRYAFQPRMWDPFPGHFTKFIIKISKE